MAVLEQENNLSCNGAAVWKVLADFGNFLPWATGGEGCANLEGEGVGMIRHLTVPGVGEVSERLDKLDEASRTLAYSLTSENMAGMKRYSAVVQVVADGAEHCTLKWRGEFEPQAGIDIDDARNSLAGAYDMMARRLEAYINGQA